MTTAVHITPAREKRFYRDAVKASLEDFYGKSKPEATRLVRGWWNRLTATKAYESGIFLHAEPINTAADIAGMPAIAITRHNRAKYHRVLDQERVPILSKTIPAPAPARLKRLKADRQKQLLPVSSPSASPSSRTPEVLGKKAKARKAVEQHQVA